jgi:hypothetical protein
VPPLLMADVSRMDGVIWRRSPRTTTPVLDTSLASAPSAAFFSRISRLQFATVFLLGPSATSNTSVLRLFQSGSGPTNARSRATMTYLLSFPFGSRSMKPPVSPARNLSLTISRSSFETRWPGANRSSSVSWYVICLCACSAFVSGSPDLGGTARTSSRRSCALSSATAYHLHRPHRRHPRGWFGAQRSTRTRRERGEGVPCDSRFRCRGPRGGL